MLRHFTFVITLLLTLCTGLVMAQCPVNIGFDSGDFTNWSFATGTLAPGNTTGIPDFTAYTLDASVFSIIKRSAQLTDKYGQFSLTSPNGSGAIAKLGNDVTGNSSNDGNHAQKLSYTFTVPVNDNEFSLIYYYAVVLEDPADNASHNDFTKPKFTAAIIDVATGAPLACANFNFVSISALPNFIKAPVQKNNDVYYKDWSPVTIDLRGLAGKALRLEFTTNNCAPGGHFGYAYIDVNANCNSPVSGNIICPGSNSITLQAPSGFASYAWYIGPKANITNTSVPLSTNSSYTVSPAPPTGTQYSIAIVPYPNLGCPDTITTTVQTPTAGSLIFTIPKDTIPSCASVPVNLTLPSITAGSDTTFLFSYCTDAQATTFINDPTSVTAGTYYIQAISPSGCNYIKPITVIAKPSPTLKITNPPEVCAPATVSITAPAVTAGSTLVDSLSYWADQAATIRLTRPDSITKSGTYYIKAVATNTCADIEPVTVLIDDLPVLVTHNTQGCNTADITVPAATAGSSSGFTPSYWADSAATVPLTNPTAISTNGVYYIKAVTPAGCTVTKPINVAVFPYPNSPPTNPPGQVFPLTVDITNSFTKQTGTAYTYWLDSLTTKPIPDPAHINKRGTYYIKALNGDNCAVVYPVVVTIYAPAAVDYDVNTFTPNGDGKNDRFRIVTPDSFQVSHFRIYGSWGALLFDGTDSNYGWDGNVNGKPMPVGTYYWILDGFDTYTKKNVEKSGSVTLVR